MIACVLWYYRQRVQDKTSIEWRVRGDDHPDPTDPDPDPADGATVQTDCAELPTETRS